MNSVGGCNSYRSESANARLLIVIHGYEPPGWGTAAGRALSLWSEPAIRVLGVLDVPRAQFTSLLPGARRAYHSARAAWRDHEEMRVQTVIDQIMPFLPGPAESLYVPAVNSSLVGLITEHVARWSADVVMIAAPTPGIRTWLWPGPVHERFLRHATCAVLITPAAGPPRNNPAWSEDSATPSGARQGVALNRGI